MKKSIFLFAAALISLSTAAQVEVKSIDALSGTKGMGLYHPQFSAKGDYLLCTNASYKGLHKYDLVSHQLTQLTDADNAGYEAQISDGGKVVVFRNVEYINNRRFTSIHRVNVETGEQAIVDQPSRDKYPFNFSGGTIRVGKRDRVLSQRLLTDIRPVENKYIIGIEDMNLVLYVNNTRRVLNPQGDGSYIWPSISPDQKHIVYTLTRGSGFGTYVCDMEGKNVQSLGYIGAPQWLGNDYIVGMLDLWDDGYKYTHSPLITIRIDGENQKVIEVPEHEVVLYPAASKQGDKIAFEADGTLYLMNVEIK